MCDISGEKELYLVVLNSSYVGLTTIGERDRSVINKPVMKISKEFGFKNFNDYLWCLPGFRININEKYYSGTRVAYEVKNDVGKTVSVNFYKTKYKKHIYPSRMKMVWDPYRICEDEYLNIEYFIDLFKNNIDTFMLCVQPTIDEVKEIRDHSSLNDNEFWFCSDWKE